MVLWMMWIAWSSLTGCDNSAAEAMRTCEGGNTEACFNDGMAAMVAAKPKFNEARKAFSAACRPSVGSPGAGSTVSQHRPKACNELARLLRDAKGGPKDEPRAIEMFEIACKDGIDIACVDLAHLLYSDLPEKADSAVRAVVLFADACAKVDPTQPPTPEEVAQKKSNPVPLSDACDALGRAYESGIGVEPPKADEEKALTLYTKACDARFAQGCVSAGTLSASKKRKEDIEKAAALYEVACKLDARHGCFELAELHAKHAWPGAEDAKAVAFYKKTCNIDPTRGCFEAGALMEEGRAEAREGEIESLYNLACEHGDSIACARRAAK